MLAQVGTIVEQLDESTALVEFSDDEGRAYAIVRRPCDAFAGLADHAARRVRRHDEIDLGAASKN